jgi:hypothetical protein
MMKRLALVGLLLALPLVAAPLLWAAAGGGREADRGTLAEFRQARAAAAKPRPLVEGLRATPQRVVLRVSRAAAIEVDIRARDGRLVQRLGHFTTAGRQRLILSWRGADVPRGAVAVGRADGRVFRAPVRVRRLARADDADRQPVRQ